MSLPVINTIKEKFINCGPTDPNVIFYTTSELIELVEEIIPVSDICEFKKELSEAGFTYHDIGTNDIMIRWCFKPKEF